MEVPTLKAIRSKPLIKQQQKKQTHVAQKIEDLDFGYMEELERKKMFMMIRLGYVRDPSRSQPVHNYEKIPVLPKKKRKNITPSPRASPMREVSQQRCDCSLPTMSARVFEDPYQMQQINSSNKQKLDQKQRRLNVINKRILNKFDNL